MVDLIYFSTSIKCVKCGRERKGQLAIDMDTLTVADSAGFMLFGHGPTCDECAKEGID